MIGDKKFFANCFRNVKINKDFLNYFSIKIEVEKEREDE